MKMRLKKKKDEEEEERKKERKDGYQSPRTWGRFPMKQG
jgi:hypothetical protein